MNSSTPYFLNRELQNITRSLNRNDKMANATIVLSCVAIALVIWQEWAKVEEKKEQKGWSR